MIFGIGSAFLKVWVRVRVRFIKYALKQGNVICVNENEAFKFKNLVMKNSKKEGIIGLTIDHKLNLKVILRNSIKKCRRMISIILRES